ncbi:hypothetical protein MCG98_05600 [Ruminococcus sp. OA3]|uniref:hypothetical protein n=1 Tax=Ruminococcus sp. OA3 TaxID=2914164 RepID=UPI001F06345A|nr:hypothetical protein [Ruminococcus sp. OA3]MCH1982036.1 hypothetical protein [Ruminococcus sp. OA3]
MDAVQICEIGMLILFGASWPFNIIKSWKSQTTKGKSIAFEFIVITGYMLGFVGKIVSCYRTGNLAYSAWFYIADIVMVAIDIGIYFRNRKTDQRLEKHAI